MKHHSLNGTTLLETLVSLIIVTSCFSIGIMIMTNSSHSGSANEGLKAITLIAEIENDTVLWFNDKSFEIEKDEGKIVVNCNQYEEVENLNVISLVIFNKTGRQVFKKTNLKYEDK